MWGPEVTVFTPGDSLSSLSCKGGTKRDFHTKILVILEDITLTCQRQTPEALFSLSLILEAIFSNRTQNILLSISHIVPMAGRHHFTLSMEESDDYDAQQLFNVHICQ